MCQVCNVNTLKLPFSKSGDRGMRVCSKSSPLRLAEHAARNLNYINWGFESRSGMRVLRFGFFERF